MMKAACSTPSTAAGAALPAPSFWSASFWPGSFRAASLWLASSSVSYARPRRSCPSAPPVLPLWDWPAAAADPEPAKPFAAASSAVEMLQSPELLLLLSSQHLGRESGEDLACAMVSQLGPRSSARLLPLCCRCGTGLQQKQRKSIHMWFSPLDSGPGHDLTSVCVIH